jgi:hypothetical protein
MPRNNRKNNGKPRRSRGGSGYKSKLELSEKMVSTPESIWGTLLADRKQQDMHTLIGVYDNTFATTGAGVNADVYGSTPTVVSNWTALASVFDEYRVLALKLKFRKLDVHGGATQTIWAPISIVTDYDNSAASTGYTLNAQYSSVKEFGGNTNWEYTAYMSGVENANFISTASPAAAFWIKLYSSGNTASVTLGRVQLEYIIQFRGKGI